MLSCGRLDGPSLLRHARRLDRFRPVQVESDLFVARRVLRQRFGVQFVADERQ